MRYLSQEWIAAADAALAAAWDEVDERGEATTAVRWEINGGPDGKIVYTMHFGPDGAGVTAGPAPEEGHPDATMSTDYDTAVAIATGETSPQVAFMQGGLKLGGDVRVLIERAPALAAMGDALAALRPRTEF